MKVAAIVEGEGEVAALPLLLRRLAQWRTPTVMPELPVPIKVRRDRFLNREDEFRRFLLLAAEKCGADGWVLLLLDADDACPATLAQEILARAAACIGHRRISVVLANREYEAWFIAAARSLDGYRGFSFDSADVVDAEEPRDAKGWLRRRITGHVYGETTDQPAFSVRMDLQEAFAGSRSFRKLCSEWEKQVALAERLTGR